MPPNAKTRKALERLYVKQRLRRPPGGRGDPDAPAFYRGPAMVKPPVVYIAGLLRARRRGVDTSDWSWIVRPRRAAALRPPNVAGWDDDRWLDTSTFRGRWIAANEIAGYDAIDDEAPTAPTESPKEAVRKALALLGRPGAQRHDPQDAGALRRRRRRRRRPPTGSRTPSALLRQNALRMLIATSPEMQTLLRSDEMGCNHCDEFSRAQLLRRAAAEAGRGLPAIEPGMPAPAGTGLNRRSFLLRSSAAMLSVYGASKLRLGDLEDGIAKAAGSNDRVLVSVFLDGGVDSLSVLAPTTDPTYRVAAPEPGPAGDAGTAFTEDPRLRWHPAAAAFDDLHREGKVSVAPAIGYEPRPVALHLAPLLGGRRPARERDHRLARPPARPDRDGRQPAPGPLAGRVAVAGARHRRRSRWRRSTGPPTTSGRGACGARSRS